MKNKLISMVDFVDNHRGRFKTASRENIAIQIAEKLDLYENYATFLNTPLNISMFVPAIEFDGKWEVLEMPPHYKEKISFFDGKVIPDELIKQVEQYQQSKDKVIFEGFEVHTTQKGVNKIFNNDFLLVIDNLTINDLIKYAPTLTAYGQELSGLNK